jgi:hypothetical protein
MLVLKWILMITVSLIVLSLGGGYFYFNKKFTPKKNDLLVENTSGNVPIYWQRNKDSDIAAMLLPVTIQGVAVPLYMQLDCGSPNTIFYSRALESIALNFPDAIQYSDSLQQASLAYSLGNLLISSPSFDVLEYGKSINLTDSVNIIGTIGADLLEKRISIMDFRNNICSFTTELPASINKNLLQPLKFTKRKIILPGRVNGKEFEFLFDSGTSAYSLITNQEKYEEYAKAGSEEVLTKANSWGKTLTVHTKQSDKAIHFGPSQVPLKDVTFIEGTTFIQNTLMRFSGMDGMIGNKLFEDKVVVLDCKNEKFAIIADFAYENTH